jgi:hypothetical protein
MEKLDEGGVVDTKSIAEVGKELVAHIELQKSWFDINKLVQIIKADKKNTEQINLVFPDNSTIFKLITLEEDEIIRLCDSVFTRFL